MNKIVKEITVFLLFSYLAVWLGILIVYFLDLKSESENLTYIDEIFLTQLLFFVWILCIVFLYILRLLTHFVLKKFE
jgi:hypothetical protein